MTAYAQQFIPGTVGAFEGELIIDLFAGGGGASEGIEKATGRSPDFACNHSPIAIKCHEANHPATEHACADVHDIHPLKITKNAPVGALHASPDCRHFSRAKGAKPVSKKVRSLANVVLWWARHAQPRIITLENVAEFLDWGPLKGKRPDPMRKGNLFRRWKWRLEAHGYTVEYRLLRGCDYGAPTTRLRLFIIARRDGVAIQWPEPTHGPGLTPYGEQFMSDTLIAFADGQSSEKPEGMKWDKEDVYDSQISPLVKQIIEICQAHDMPLVVNVQFAEFSHCTTHITSERANPVYRLMASLAHCHQSNGWNVDKFMFPIMKKARETGHGSIVLSQLGIPIVPDQATVKD